MLGALLHRLALIRFLREVALIGSAYMAYELVRSLSADRVADALTNAFHIIRVEQALGIFTELNIQLAVLGFDLVTDLLSLWYFWGHFPLMIAVGIWLLYRHPGDYRWARNAFLISGAVALVLYVTFPVAPPRLLPGAGFVDTLKGVVVLQYDDSGLVNQFAAVPSMHQGFALIVGAALFRSYGSRRGLLWLLLLPSLMFISIVATGNHWILDAVFGLGVALVGMSAATYLETHGRRLKAALLRRLRGGGELPIPTGT